MVRIFAPAWVEKSLHIFSDCGLEYLLSLMPPEVVPFCLGGRSHIDQVPGGGGRLTYSDSCMKMPWRRTKRVVLWQPSQPESFSASEQREVNAITEHIKRMSERASDTDKVSQISA